MFDALRLSSAAAPRRLTEMPTAWAGGRKVVVPGVGVGRVLREGTPRVVEIPLGAPTAAVFTVPDETGTARATILADPALSPEQLDKLISAGELLDAEGVAVQHTPRIPGPRRHRPGRGTAYGAAVFLAGVAAVIGATLASADPNTMREAMKVKTETAASTVTRTVPAAV